VASQASISKSLGNTEGLVPLVPLLGSSLTTTALASIVFPEESCWVDAGFIVEVMAAIELLERTAWCL
jgi:hypothetical protein